MKIKCPRCKHEWITKSKMIWVTCPSCQYKSKTLRIDKTLEKNLKKIIKKVSEAKTGEVVIFDEAKEEKDD